MKQIFLLLLILYNSICFSQKLLLENFNTSFTDEANNACEDTQENIYIATSIRSNLGGALKSVIYKTDKYGNDINSKTVLNGIDSSFYINSIFYISPNKFVLYGVKLDLITDSSSIYFSCEMDSNLQYSDFIFYPQSIPNSTYPFHKLSYVNTIKTTNGFVGVLHYFDLSLPAFFVYISKQNNDRLNITEQLYSIDNFDRIKITENIDTPNTFSILSNTYGFQVTRLDSNLLPTVVKNLTTNPLQIFKIKNIKAISANSVLILSQNDISANNKIAAIYKFNQIDTLLTIKDTLSRIKNSQSPIYPEENSSIDFINSNNIFNAITYSSADSFNHIAIENIDSNLNTRWTKRFGFNKNPRLNNIVATKDGGCLVLASQKEPTNFQFKDFYIFKIDSLGVPLWMNTFSENEKIKASIFPNPCMDVLNIVSDEKIEHYKIIDMQGKIVLSNKFEKNISVQQLSKGIYVIELSNKNKKAQKLFNKL